MVFRSKHGKMKVFVHFQELIDASWTHGLGRGQFLKPPILKIRTFGFSIKTWKNEGFRAFPRANRRELDPRIGEGSVFETSHTKNQNLWVFDQKNGKVKVIIVIQKKSQHMFF